MHAQPHRIKKKMQSWVFAKVGASLSIFLPEILHFNPIYYFFDFFQNYSLNLIFYGKRHKNKKLKKKTHNKHKSSCRMANIFKLLLLL